MGFHGVNHQFSTCVVESKGVVVVFEEAVGMERGGDLGENPLTACTNGDISLLKIMVAATTLAHYSIDFDETM